MNTITDIIGRPTINPVLFWSGKIAGYLTWILLILSVSGINILIRHRFLYNDIISWFLLAAGLTISVISIFQLGKSTHLGLPAGKTAFKTNGLYKISRNPMYLGFDLITLSSIIYFLNVMVLLPGIYSIVIYHLIITGEEKYLIKEFGQDYQEYKLKVRRYI